MALFKSCHIHLQPCVLNKPPHIKFCVLYNVYCIDLISSHSASVFGRAMVSSRLWSLSGLISRMPFTSSDIRRAPNQTRSSGSLQFRSAQFLSLYGRHVFRIGGGSCAPNSKDITKQKNSLDILRKTGVQLLEMVKHNQATAWRCRKMRFSATSSCPECITVTGSSLI